MSNEEKDKCKGECTDCQNCTPKSDSVEQAVALACEQPTLLDAFASIAVWEFERARHLVKPNVPYETCFKHCLRLVEREYIHKHTEKDSGVHQIDLSASEVQVGVRIEIGVYTLAIYDKDSMWLGNTMGEGMQVWNKDFLTLISNYFAENF